MNAFLNETVAQLIAGQICDPAGYGKRVTLTRDDRFERPAHADSTPLFDSMYEEMWPYLAKNVLHTLTTFERKNRVRADIWTAAKTGSRHAGTPDLVVPIATFYGAEVMTRAKNGHVQASLDLPDAAQRVTAHVRLHGLVPANRILETWIWASELAEQGEVQGHEVTWSVSKYHLVQHFVDGQQITSVSVDDLSTYWTQISALHDACL